MDACMLGRCRDDTNYLQQHVGGKTHEADEGTGGHTARFTGLR